MLFSCFPQLNWTHYANAMLKVTGLQVKPSEKILVYAPEYLQKLETLLEDMLSTPEKKK